MDLILSVVLLIGISIFKISSKTDTVVEQTYIDETGETVTSKVNETTLTIGTNLMLLREPRAYHKILDEMGLG